MKKIALSLVIAQPGHLRNGLQSLLATIPQIEIQGVSSSMSILMKMDEGIQPELIIVDASIIDEINWSVLKNLHSSLPESKILVLTEDDEQNKKALAAGADYCFPQGYPATELARLIESTLGGSQTKEVSFVIKNKN